MPEGGGLALAIDNADAGMPHINPAGFCSPLRNVIFAAPQRATRQRAQWPRPLHSGPVRQIVPPLRGTFGYSRPGLWINTYADMQYVNPVGFCSP